MDLVPNRAKSRTSVCQRLSFERGGNRRQERLCGCKYRSRTGQLQALLPFKPASFRCIKPVPLQSIPGPPSDHGNIKVQQCSAWFRLIPGSRRHTAAVQQTVTKQLVMVLGLFQTGRSFSEGGFFVLSQLKTESGVNTESRTG